MAEFVQLRKEKWTDPLNLLMQVDLLNQDEIRSVLFNLDQFEHKIQSQNRKLEDILAYIQFECKLLMEIQRRRIKRKQYDLSEEIDRFLYNEIRAQFGSAELNFKHSMEFWNAKIQFIANIVPDKDKEAEFNLLFKKAINYCGRANLDIYRHCIDYLWTFAKSTNLPRKRKSVNKITRRNASKLMDNIRHYTNEALRNFPSDPEASLLHLMTELKYLELLREEEEFYSENPKIFIPYDIKEEVQKSEKLINLIYENLLTKHSETPSVYIQLFEAIRWLPLLEARQLSKRIYAKMLSIQHRTPEVITWLIEKSIDDSNIDEFIERMNQALSSSGPKLKMLEMCLDKLDCFLEKALLIEDSEYCLPKLLLFYTELVHKDNPEWNEVSSEVLLNRRLHVIRRLPQLIETLSENSDRKVISNLQDFLRQHDIEKIVKHFVKQFPFSFILVKERILLLLSQGNEDKIKPALICKYLAGVNWQLCEKNDGLNLLKFIYFAFLTVKKLSKASKLNMFLNLSPSSVPGMNEIRLMHLRKLYIEDFDRGRDFYKRIRLQTSDWRLACETLKFETTACKEYNKCSEVLLLAYEDAMMHAGTSTEPWKACILSKYELQMEKEANLCFDRALKNFSSEGKTAMHEDLLLFWKNLDRVYS